MGRSGEGAILTEFGIRFTPSYTAENPVGSWEYCMEKLVALVCEPLAE